MKYKIIMFREKGYPDGGKTLEIETDIYFQENLNDMIELGLADKIEVEEIY